MMMVMGLFPATAVATAPEHITAYITISVAGAIPQGRDDTLIAQVPVTVTDQNNNGIFDIDDALFALHESYYPGGAALGYTSADSSHGLGITRLWGDISGAYGYWVNNAMAGSLTDEVSPGTSITAFVYVDAVGWSDSYVRFDAFTKTAAVGEAVPLKLEKAGYNESWNMVWSPLPNASVYVIAGDDGSVVSSTTDSLGEATISFPAMGAYYITASHPTANMVPPVCKIIVTEEGEPPSANDTTLSALTLTFLDAPPSNGLPYVGTRGMSVGPAVQSVVLTATTSASGATVAATYQAAGHAVADYHLGDSTALGIGENTFKLTVTNGADTQIHTLVLTRSAAERNIPGEVETVKNGAKTVTGDAPETDWVLAMNASGLVLTEAQLQTYLAAVLTMVTSFVDQGTGSPAQMAKIALALTALGIDPRQIPDPDGGAAIDLIKFAVAYDVKADLYPVYSAPYLLSLYDLGNYEIPAGAASTRLELIDALLNAKEDWTAWGYDGVGMVLPALAPYYKTAAPVNGIDLAKCGEITAAVDEILGLMSAAQTIDGGFGASNSNTVSTVITGLSAIGVNVHTDDHWRKSGTSLLMNLLSFRTAEDKLGFADSASANILASVQGFQALAVWQNLSNQRSSNLYHFTKEIAPYTNWPNARLLTGIAITTLPSTVTYSLGAAVSVPNTTGIVVTATYNAKTKEIVDIADCTVSTIDCRAAGTKTVTVTYQGKTATFLVTVLDANGTVPKQDTVSVVIQNGNKVIAKNSKLVIEKGETSALDVLKTVLDEAGRPYVIRNSSYVAEIDGLGEFDQGANSGWLYSINGVTPQATAAGDYTLSDGDTVLWYYTLNYATDSSAAPWTRPAQSELLAPSAVISQGTASAVVSAAEMTAAIAAVRQNNSTELVIEPKITEAVTQAAVVLQKSSLADLSAQTAAALWVQTPVGSVMIPNGALDSIVSQAAGSTVTVTLKSVNHMTLTVGQQEAVGGKRVFDISILSGKDLITSFGNAAITISLPYALQSGEEASGVVVWYLSGEGRLQQMTAAYDTKAGLVTFLTPHLSHYVVGYMAPWQNPFSDVGSTDWFYDAVRYAARGGLFHGISDVTFAPNEPMTRAMLITVLFRLEGSPAVTGVSGFEDVQSGQWYSNAVIWASNRQIVSGYDSGLYGVNDPITREQLAVILYRYACYKGDDVTKTVDLSHYTDAATVSPWAEDAMGWANAGGLMAGTTATMLAPTECATRAQVATILMRFVGS